MSADPRVAPSENPRESASPARGQRLPRSERRIQLLEAALAVFVENGYHQAAMDDIAARAGVSKPVLYQHFPGKLELYLALVDQHSSELEALVRDALSLGDNKSRINTMVGAFYGFVAQEGAAYRLIFESDLANEPEVRRRLDQVDRVCAEAMAEIIRGETSMGHDESRLVGFGALGLAQTSARYWLDHADTLPQADAIRLTSALIRRGFGAFPAVTKDGTLDGAADGTPGGGADGTKESAASPTG